MTDKTMKDHFIEAMVYILRETFEEVRGVYLDKGTSLFETLATITAEEASQPVSATCASLAAQVEHIRFYLDLTIEFAQGRDPGKVDWGHIWRTVQAVSPEEWETSKQRLYETYINVVQLVKTYPDWDKADMNVIGSAMGMIIHTAYHLGEIRQALCTIKNSSS